MIDTVSERNALATKLKSIGMEVYLTILYPELKKDPNITWQEISRRYPRYNSLSVLAQQSRFSNARSIIRNGWEEDALRMIADSRADIYVVELAKEYLKNDGHTFKEAVINHKSNIEQSPNKPTNHFFQPKDNDNIKQNFDYDKLSMLLKAIGKDIFITILYPEFKHNPNITWQEISNKYPRYSGFSINSQRGRCSSTRFIFKNGWEMEALKLISESHASQEIIFLANKYLNETPINPDRSNSQPIPHKANQHKISTAIHRPCSLEQNHTQKTAPIHVQEGQKGVSYKSLFADYLIDATEIIVEDPYIILPYQIQNLIDFLTMTLEINPNMKTHLVTNFDNLKQKQEIKRTLSNLQHEIPSFSFEFKSFHDRCIKTNTGWFISMGRGLDIFHPYDKFSLLCKKQENRPCKDFTVTYTKE